MRHDCQKEEAIVLRGLLRGPVFGRVVPGRGLPGGAAGTAAGRPNQISNVLAFPGVFRGALDVRARTVAEGMKLAAADALAALAGDDLTAGYVIPDAFDGRVAPAMAAAVAARARTDGVARV